MYHKVILLLTFFDNILWYYNFTHPIIIVVLLKDRMNTYSLNKNNFLNGNLGVFSDNLYNGKG